MTIVLILAMIVGLLEANRAIYNVRNGFDSGVKPSDNLISFVFLNKNE